jgi:protein-S-isoprenylcysteine O-methyltransferase Ste14
MTTNLLALNRGMVLGSGLVYWAGVWIQARRVRRWIGYSPNVRPHGPKERLLWLGWFFVVVGWLSLPFLSGSSGSFAGSLIIRSVIRPVGSALGVMLMVAGYGGTLWCYAAMGSSWRMGIKPNEQTNLVTRGPYRKVRHPIYLCQMAMVAAVAILLPSVISLLVLVIHVVCVLTKAADEESHLRMLLGRSYEEYRGRTGAWLPRLHRGKPNVNSMSLLD